MLSTLWCSARDLLVKHQNMCLFSVFCNYHNLSELAVVVWPRFETADETGIDTTKSKKTAIHMNLYGYHLVYQQGLVSFR